MSLPEQFADFVELLLRQQTPDGFIDAEFPADGLGGVGSVPCQKNGAVSLAIQSTDGFVGLGAKLVRQRDAAKEVFIPSHENYGVSRSLLRDHGIENVFRNLDTVFF